MRMRPASTENTVRPLDEIFLNNWAHGFDVWAGNTVDKTGLVNTRIIPAIMARTLEYLLSMFTNAVEASPQLAANSSAKRMKIPFTMKMD
jgi:hypothetical protein